MVKEMSLPTPYYDEGGITIYHGNCRDILPYLDEADLVLTDPPYGETSLEWDTWNNEWPGLINIKQTGSLWCFGSMRMFLDWGSIAFREFHLAQDVVWEKQNGSGWCADRFKRVHEHVTHWYNGSWDDVYKAPVKQPTQHEHNKSVRTRNHTATVHRGKIGQGHYVDDGTRLVRSVIATPNCHSEAEHPTQKPTELLAVFILYSCPPSGLVIDPFCGSGSTLIAAKSLGRRAIGIEIEEKYCEIAVRRLAQEVLPL